MTDDDDLREQFAYLRQQGGNRAPSFASVLVRATGRLPVHVVAWRFAGAALLGAGAALAVWFSSASNPDISIPAAPMLSWKSPTDFLLNMPQQAFLRTVPKLGEIPSRLPVVNDESPPITQQLSSLSENAS